MPVLQRLDWIAYKIEQGWSFHLSVGNALKPGTMKYKVTLSPPVSGAAHNLDGSLAVVSWMRHVFSNAIIVDRGHQHSSGRSEVSFYHSGTYQEQLVTAVVDNDQDMLPPVPPPACLPSTINNDRLDAMERSIHSMSEHVLAGCWYSQYMCQLQEQQQQLQQQRDMSSMQDLVETQNRTIAAYQGRVNLEQQINDKMLVLTNSLMGRNECQSTSDVATQFPDRMKRYCFRRIVNIVGELATADAQVQTCIGVVDSAVQSLICRLEDAGTQVTARMIADEFPDSDLVMLSAQPGEENCESESDANFDPDVVETSSEEEEEYVSVSESIKKSSRFWHKRVYESATRQKGTVVDIFRGVDSNTVVYAVRFDDGEYDDRISRDEVKKLTAAYVALKDSSKSKSASSKSR